MSRQSLRAGGQALKIKHGSGSHVIATEPGCPINCRSTDFVVHTLEGPISAVPLGIDLEGSILRVRIPESRGSRADAGHIAAARVALGSPSGVKVYCRIAPKVELSKQFAPEVAQSIADGLKEIAEGGADRHTDALPAAYTYLGQFIAHEVSNLAVLNEEGGVSGRTPAIDLDSLFDAPSGGQNQLQEQVWSAGTGVGRARVTKGVEGYQDLPRMSDGTPMIADMRNDDNLGLAQIHLAISKFHQNVFNNDVYPPSPDQHDRAKIKTMRHVQAVILFDYLKRLIDHDIYCEVRKNGRKIIDFEKCAGSGAFLVPIEFSAALFRVGHSMPRNEYLRWRRDDSNAELWKLLDFSSRGGGLGVPKFLPAEWALPWDRMLGNWRDPKSVLNKASSIDLQMAREMFELPANRFDDDSVITESLMIDHGFKKVNLAKITIDRGRSCELPSAQDLITFLNKNHGCKIPKICSDEILEVVEAACPESRLMKRTLRESDLHRSTPLWLYALIEGSKCGKGQRLGPLASRVVMETIHAAIEASEEGIINAGRTINFSQNECVAGTDEFNLHQLVRSASEWSPAS